MVVQPFQKRVLSDYFAGARETALIIPKKNGKTTLLAALALYHLVVIPNAECIIVAASREQAEIVLRQARMFVRGSEALQRLMTIQQRSVVSKMDEGRIRVLASDADTADGSIPTLAIVDELHRHKSAELYAVLRDGLGPRTGQLITISTAGFAMDSPLGKLRTAAHLLPGFVRKGKHNHVRSENGMFAFHEWCMDPTDDIDDIAQVKRANPAPWQTPAALRERHDSQTMTPWEWQRFACGIWTEGEEPWIEPKSWDDLADPSIEIPAGARAWLGVDLGVKHDSTAIAAAHVTDDGKVIVRVDIMKPEGVLPIERVEAKIREVAARYTVQKIAYDPWSFRRSAEILEGDGLPMQEYPQSAERMSVASAALYRVIDAGLLRHDGDLVLRAHVMGGVTKETERGWRLQKDPRSHRSIDALIALTMAVQMATEADRASVPMIAFV